MQPLRLLAFWLLAGSVLVAQTAENRRAGDVSDAPMPLVSGATLSAPQLERLLAPIALYPDALIALMLPAATVPADIVLAARHLRASGNDRSQIEHRSWDDSVKSLTHYPDVLLWMDENLPWTKQVGEAFQEQPVEVMQTIQRLRARARAAGTLVDSPEQQVLTDFEVIRIVPAQPEILYIPYYDSDLFFLSQPLAYPRPFLTFGTALPVGAWLAFECDWRRHMIWMGSRHRRWHHSDWRQPVVPIPITLPPNGSSHGGVRAWRPAPRPARPPIPPPVDGSEAPRRSVGPPVSISPGINPPHHRKHPTDVENRSGNNEPPGARPRPSPPANQMTTPRTETVVTPVASPPPPLPPTTRPSPRRDVDHPRPTTTVPHETGAPRPFPPPQASPSSAPAGRQYRETPPAARPRESESTHRPTTSNTVRHAPSSSPAPSQAAPAASSSAPSSNSAQPSRRPPSTATPNPNAP